MPQLTPNPRRNSAVSHDAAFLYLSVRGAVAERWGHGSGFGRHSIGPDSLVLLNKNGSRQAHVNLKNSAFVESAPALDWNKFVPGASEFLSDCLKTLQPAAVVNINCVVRLCSETKTFSSMLDKIASALLTGHYRHPPSEAARFEDLSVSLQFKENLVTITTTMAPMRRNGKLLSNSLKGTKTSSCSPRTCCLWNVGSSWSRGAGEAKLDLAGRGTTATAVAR